MHAICTVVKKKFIVYTVSTIMKVYKINSEKKHIREGNYRGTVSTAKVMNSRRLLKFPICNIFIELHLSSCLDFFIHDVA